MPTPTIIAYLQKIITGIASAIRKPGLESMHEIVEVFINVNQENRQIILAFLYKPEADEFMPAKLSFLVITPGSSIELNARHLGNL